MPRAAIASPNQAPSVTGSPSAALPALCRLAVADVVEAEADTVTVLTAPPFPSVVGPAMTCVEVTGVGPEGPLLRKVVVSTVEVGAAVALCPVLAADEDCELAELLEPLLDAVLDEVGVLDVLSVVSVVLDSDVTVVEMLLLYVADELRLELVLELEVVPELKHTIDPTCTVLVLSSDGLPYENGKPAFPVPFG
jgi:hypothetical protein